MEKDLVRTKEAQELLSVSKSTIERWEREGKIHPIRNGRSKYYSLEELNSLVGGTLLKRTKRKVIGYYRVSTNSQKAELENQRKMLENFSISSGRVIDEYLCDIGSGINFKRKNFLKIMDMIENEEVSELILTYKDRLTRFAFELIEERCRVRGTKLTVINILSSSPEKEVVDDLMEIIHVFSCRLYGLRKYKIKKEDLLKEEISDQDSQDQNLSE